MKHLKTPIMSVVGIEKVKNIKDKKEIKNSIFFLLEEMKNKGKLEIPENGNIMIKPNICLVKCSESGTTVDHYIVKCVVDWIISNFNPEKIYIGEADATELNIDVAFKVLGWEKTFREYNNVELINLSKDETIEVNLNGLHFNNLKMSKKYIEADYLISVGKLKTHLFTNITCILKNQFGSNPIKYKAQYHSDLDNVIVDLNSVRIPDLCIIDGLIAMEGKGPVTGFPKPMHIIIVGNDPVSTDHTCARIMGFNPNKVAHLNIAFKEGLGNFEYKTFGSEIDNLKTIFEIEPKLEKFLTRAYKNKLINILPLKRLMKIFLRG